MMSLVTIVLLETAAPVENRVSSVFRHFAGSGDTESAIRVVTAVLFIVVILAVAGRLYSSWIKRKQGFGSDYLKQRKEF